MKHPWPAIAVIAIVLFALFALDRSCVADRALAKAKADYSEQVRVLEADNAAKQDAIVTAERIIAQQEAEVSASRIAIATKDRQLTSLRADLAALQNEEPPTTPAVESLPIVINLRAQVTRLTAMFTLSEAKNGDKDRVIVSLRTIIAAKDDVIAAVTAQRDNEHALRLSAEAIAKACDSSKVGKFERVANDAEGIGVGAYSAIRYKDPLPLAIYAGKKLVVKVYRIIAK